MFWGVVKEVLLSRMVTEENTSLQRKNCSAISERYALLTFATDFLWDSEQENFLVLLLSANVWQGLSCFLWFSTNRFTWTILVDLLGQYWWIPTREGLKTQSYPAVLIYLAAFSISRNTNYINKYKIFAYIIYYYFQNRRDCLICNFKNLFLF